MYCNMKIISLFKIILMALFSYTHFILLVYIYISHFLKEEAVRSSPSLFFPFTQLAHYRRRTHCVERLVSDFVTILAPVLGSM